jgi:hypothetical protein
MTRWCSHGFVGGWLGLDATIGGVADGFGRFGNFGRDRLPLLLVLQFNFDIVKAFEKIMINFD